MLNNCSRRVMAAKDAYEITQCQRILLPFVDGLMRHIIRDMDNLLIQRINQRLSDLGKSAQRISVEATGAKETLRKILDGTTKNPRVDTVQKLATALETTSEWLMGQTDDPHSHRKTIDSSSVDPKSHPQTVAVDIPLKGIPANLPARNEMPNDVGVLGTAAGSHLRGAFQIHGDVIDYVRRPPALMGARDVYALYVEGSSMEPQYFPGDLVYVHPGRPPRPGDVVVVQAAVDNEHVEASIGIYKRQTEQHFIVKKHNPSAEVHIKRATIKAIHKVLTVNELFGV